MGAERSWKANSEPSGSPESSAPASAFTAGHLSHRVFCWNSFPRCRYLAMMSHELGDVSKLHQPLRHSRFTDSNGDATADPFTLGPVRIVPDPDTFRTWAIHQLANINLTTVALLIAIIYLSSNINSTLDQQRAANTEAAANIQQLKEWSAMASTNLATLTRYNETVREFTELVQGAYAAGLPNLAHVGTFLQAPFINPNTDVPDNGPLIDSGSIWLSASVRALTFGSQTAAPSKAKGPAALRASHAPRPFPNRWTRGRALGTSCSTSRCAFKPRPCCSPLALEERSPTARICSSTDRERTVHTCSDESWRSLWRRALQTLKQLQVGNLSALPLDFELLTSRFSGWAASSITLTDSILTFTPHHSCR